MGARTLSHNLDGNNRLGSLSGSQSVAFGYDANGNITTRGAQGFVFDIGNRLSSATGKASYNYDGHGRRVFTTYTGGATQLTVYDHNGQLRFTNHGTRGPTRYVYLGSQLIAETNATTGHSYAHNDALGSPIARTNATGQVISRTRYEPYGATHAGTNPTTIGFTGHVNDTDTALVYMQQRYYDPIPGRFLSVDPVVTDWDSGSSFNRYLYAQNSPYLYVDPDGKVAILLARAGIQMATAMYRAFVASATVAAVASAAKSLSLSQSGADSDFRTKPPADSLPIDETDWSGDHTGIKGQSDAGPRDNVRITPDGEVWVQRPGGKWENTGNAHDMIGGDQPSGKRGRDREPSWKNLKDQERKEERRLREEKKKQQDERKKEDPPAE